MRRTIISSCFLSLLVACTAAEAQDVINVTWDHPTQRIDGSNLSLEEIQNTMLFWSDQVCTQADLESAANTAIVEAPADQYQIPEVSPGEWCVAGRTIDTSGLMSDLSNVASKQVLSQPSPPDNLSTSSEMPVYTISLSRDSIAATVQVGTVPADTPCDPNQYVNGLYVVPRESVEWIGNVQPQVVVAECSAQ